MTADHSTPVSGAPRSPWEQVVGSIPARATMNEQTRLTAEIMAVATSMWACEREGVVSDVPDCDVEYIRHLAGAVPGKHCRACHRGHDAVDVNGAIWLCRLMEHLGCPWPTSDDLPEWAYNPGRSSRG